MCLFDDVTEPERERLPFAADRLRKQGGAFKPNEPIAKENAVRSGPVGNGHPPQYAKLQIRDDNFPVASEYEFVMNSFDVPRESDRDIRALRDTLAFLVHELRRTFDRANDRSRTRKHAFEPALPQSPPFVSIEVERDDFVSSSHTGKRNQNARAADANVLGTLAHEFPSPEEADRHDADDTP